MKEMCLTHLYRLATAMTLLPYLGPPMGAFTCPGDLGNALEDHTLMLLANGRVKIDLMFAALIALCLLTILLRGGIDLVGKKLEQRAAPE